MRICACAGRGNPTLCRWPGGYEWGDVAICRDRIYAACLDVWC